MISASIFVSVLALAAAAFGGLGLIILSRQTRALESQLSTTVSNCRALATKLVGVAQTVSALKSTAPTTLAAEVAELSGAVGKLADAQRRLQGRFDAFRQHEAPQPAENGAADDDELRALLELQSAPPVGPGR